MNIIFVCAAACRIRIPVRMECNLFAFRVNKVHEKCMENIIIDTNEST